MAYGVEYLVRSARITDIDRLAGLGGNAIAGSGRGSLNGADLLRQLVFLPNASILVAEAARGLAGAAVLVLRPSVVVGGYVGTVDLLVVAPGPDAERVADALIEQLLRSAGNKGCVAIEAAQPKSPEERARWERSGFRDGGSFLSRAVNVGQSAVRPV